MHRSPSRPKYCRKSGNGQSEWWDLEVFPASEMRFCYQGCALTPHTAKPGCFCNVCKSKLPTGVKTKRCSAHNYDICNYCQGAPSAVRMGMKVVRGPTWKFGDQDGSKGTEGTVVREDRAGWVTVKWPSGQEYNYRGPPFQDVTPVPRPSSSSSGADHQLRVGSRVTAPSGSDPRIRHMRVKFADGMSKQCGQTCTVVKVDETSAQIKGDDGRCWWWDLEVFAASERRFCHKGCSLARFTVQRAGCDVCKASLPRGSDALRCIDHDYVICKYCRGEPTKPVSGTKVIRGPTWKWQDQDGSKGTEGTVVGDHSPGWVTVRWPSGESNNYRGPPYQDVIPALENGVDAADGGGKDKILEQLFEAMVLAAAAKEAGASDSVAREIGKLAVAKLGPDLPVQTFQQSRGYRFVDNLKSVDCDAADKRAWCVSDYDSTTVTQEVVTVPGDYEFTVRMVKARGDKGVGWGLVDANPGNHGRRMIGEEGLRSVGSISSNSGGVVLSCLGPDGKSTPVKAAPRLWDGDMLGVRIKGDVCSLLHDGAAFYSCRVSGKFRFAVSLPEKNHTVQIEDRVLSLPRSEFDAQRGFTFLDRLSMVDCDARDKRAWCKNSGKRTTFTKQVFTSPSDLKFRLKVIKLPADKPFRWGMVDSEPVGYRHFCVGEDGMQNCIGVSSTSSGGVVLNEGNTKATTEGVKEGDIVGCNVTNAGMLELVIRETVVYSIKVTGNFRFGVSLVEEGQCCEIISAGAIAQTHDESGREPVGLGAQPPILSTISKCRWGHDLKVDSAAELGAGGFGTTYKAKLAGLDVVAKVLKREGVAAKVHQEFEAEVEALARLRHPRLLTMTAVDPDKLCIVTEWCANGDLQHYLDGNPHLGHHARLKIALDVAVGMAWLAHENFVHRDLKPQNVLVREGGQAVVGDFGLARETHNIEGIGGSILYMAPEVFQGHSSEASDVYAFAVVVRRIFGGEELGIGDFLNSSRQINPMQLLAIMAGGQDLAVGVVVGLVKEGARPKLPEHAPAGVRELIVEGWHQDRDKRPRFEAIVTRLESITANL